MKKDEAVQLRVLLEQQTKSMTDQEVLAVATYVERWSPNGVKYKAGKRVSVIEGGKAVIYKCNEGKEHVSQPLYKPGIDTASIWTKIDVEHAGTLADPIPYSGNMELVKDKYYSQDGIVYLCWNSSGNPVYERLEYLSTFVNPV